MNLGMEAVHNRLTKGLGSRYHGQSSHLSLDHLPPDGVGRQKIISVLLKTLLLEFFCHSQPNSALENSVCVVDVNSQAKLL